MMKKEPGDVPEPEAKTTTDETAQPAPAPAKAVRRETASPPAPLTDSPAGQPASPPRESEEPVPHYAFAHLRHELRTPLNQIIGFSELLMEDAETRGNALLAHDLQRINAAGRHLLARLNEIFDLARVKVRPSEADATGVPAEAPAKVEEIAASGREPATTARRVPGTAAVLVVDDEETNREVLARRMERKGYAVRSVASGREALLALECETFDLVLLDILMPGMDGLEVLTRMKAAGTLPDIPVIVISALDDMESVVKCIEMGAEDYLPKPFNPVLLNARISASLEKKRLRDSELHLYAELKENYDKLRELEQLRDDLTHMIVHDLRQPLTSFLLGARAVESMGPLNPDQAECLNLAIAGGDLLIGMVSDLLDIGKMEAGSLTPLQRNVLVPKIFDDAISQVKWLARDKCLTVRCDPAPEVMNVCADEDKLRRAIVNLLGNAVKFTPSGGTITLASRKVRDRVILSVKDTGEGIPEEAFGRIFEKFGQVQLRKEGQVLSTGLGLTFCKMVAEAHDGRAWVESKLGEGSTFYIELPG